MQTDCKTGHINGHEGLWKCDAGYREADGMWQIY